MRIRITVKNPAEGTEDEVEFASSPVRIGRRPGNDLVLRNGFVSDPHALIEFDEAGLRVVDLGSRNGTVVMGRSIPRDQPTPLSGIATVDIGPFRLTVSTPGPGEIAVSAGPPAVTARPAPESELHFTQPVPWLEAPRPVAPAPLPLVIGLQAPAWPAPVPAPALVPRAAVRAPAPRPPTEPLWELIEESFDEAKFLWRLWEEGLVSHARDLGRLASFVEERLLGALDGARVGLEVDWEPLLGAALASEERWPLTVAAHLVAGGGRAALPALIGAAEGPRLAALRRGVELLASDEDVAPVEARLAAGGPEQLAALVALRAFRRRPPGPELGAVLDADLPSVRAAGLRAARHVPQGAALGQVELALGDPDPQVAAAAVETGLILGSRAAWMRCRELARIPAPASALPLRLVGCLGTGRDLELVFAALGAAEARKGALMALAGVGTAQAAEACLEAMALPEDARLAAESFCAITGLDLHTEDLIAPEPPPPEEPIPFEAEDLDADLVAKPDDLLPLPDVEGVRRWWQKAAARFTNGRFVLGKPASLQALQEVLEVGSMRRRPAAALELAIRTGGRHDVETATFTREQRRQLLGFALVKDGRSQPPSLAGLISRI